MRVPKLSLQTYLVGKLHDISSQFINFICIVFMVISNLGTFLVIPAMTVVTSKMHNSGLCS